MVCFWNYFGLLTRIVIKMIKINQYNIIFVITYLTSKEYKNIMTVQLEEERRRM